MNEVALRHVILSVLQFSPRHYHPINPPYSSSTILCPHQDKWAKHLWAFVACSRVNLTFTFTFYLLPLPLTVEVFQTTKYITAFCSFRPFDLAFVSVFLDYSSTLPFVICYSLNLYSRGICLSFLLYHSLCFVFLRSAPKFPCSCSDTKALKVETFGKSAVLENT